MNENVKSKLNKSYTCPENSYISTSKWPLTGFEDCHCNWDYTRSDSGCAKPGTPVPTPTAAPTPAPTPVPYKYKPVWADNQSCKSETITCGDP